MFKKLAALLVMLCGSSAFAQSHTLPTLDRNNAWTGVNTYVPGNLQLGNTNQVCSGSQIMTGITYQFVPICGSSMSTGVTSFNGLTGAVVIAAGTNITFSTTGNTITINSTGGGGGGGNLNTLPNDELTNNSSNVAQDMYNFITSASYSPQTAVNAAVSNSGMATLMPTGSGVFTNSSNVKVVDYQHKGAMYRSLTEWGAQCDTRDVFVTVPLSSTTVSIYSDFFYPYDVGKTLVLTGTVGGVPTAYETVVTALIAPSGGRSASATVTTAAPFAVTSITTAPLGHDDTSSVQTALNFGAGLTIPAGSCLVHKLTYTGVSLLGLDQNDSALNGMPGESIMVQGDPSLGSSSAGYGVHISNFTAYVDNRIDATQAWQIINDSGSTSETALYQPTGILTAASNNPLAPGWFQGSGPNFSGAIVGVGAINSGTPTLMTVPAGVNLPTASQKIVFPYLSTVVTTTVASVNTGTRVVTLNASYPGSTASQIEWFAGTSPQTVGATVSGGSCPASIIVTNPVTPTPVSESNVAPVGLIQIDSEQFTYQGRTNAGNTSSQYLTITACAQNGTSRASHSIGATIVPLNPFKPATPWPVTPTINSGATTPTLAAYYPAWNVGNGFWEAPVANGATGTFGVGSFANAAVDNLHIDASPTNDVINNTTGFYFVSLPYSTSFRDMDITGYYGIEEGVPAFNSGGGWAAAQPTADGTRWEGIRINACNIMEIVAGNQNTYKDFNTYSNCETAPGTYVGAHTAWYFNWSYNDQTGGLLSFTSNSQLINMYDEPSNVGSQYGLYPIFQMDCFSCLWQDMHMGGGGENYIGGSSQHWTGGNFNNATVFPTIDYGVGNGADYGNVMITNNPLSNIYGVSGFIEYGTNSNWIGGTGNQGANGAYGPVSVGVGSSRQPIPAQTNETWNTGNINNMYVSSNGGFIPAYEFNTSYSFESQPFPVAWHYDSSKLPDGSIAGGAVGCNLSGTAQNDCFSYRFNQNAIFVGPEQRIAAGKYTMYVAAKSTGAATNYRLSLGACSPGNVGSYTVPVSSTYSVFSVQVDFTPYGTCGGGIGLGFGYANASDTLSVAYVDFAPVGQQPTDYNVNILNQILLNGSSGTTGQCIVSGGSGSPDVWGTCGSGGGGGSVNSVGLAAPSWLTVTNSPVTSTGTLTLTSAVLAQGLFLATPASGSGQLTPRAIVASDIPSGLAYLTGLSGDVSASGSGVVASNINRIGGGTALSTFTGLLQNNAGTVVQATTFNLTGPGQVGTRYLSGVNVVAFSATPNFDLSLGDTQTITLTGDVSSSTLSNTPTGNATQMVRFIICQDGTGGHKFVWPLVIQGITPVTMTASQCTSLFTNATASAVITDNFNTENCVSSANPAVCDQATIGEVAVPTGTNSTLQINTTSWTAHSQIIFTPDTTKGADLSVTCNTSAPLPYQVTGAVAATSVTLTFYGTITTNPECGTFSIRNP